MTNTGTSEKLVHLFFALTGFGYRDIQQVAEWLDAANLDYGHFGRFVDARIADTSAVLISLDVPALVLEYIAHEAGTPELAPHIYANSICSSFDVSEDEASRILYAVDESDRNAAWHLLVRLTGASEPRQDEDALAT